MFIDFDIGKYLTYHKLISLLNYKIECFVNIDIFAW